MTGAAMRRATPKAPVRGVILGLAGAAWLAFAGIGAAQEPAGTVRVLIETEAGVITADIRADAAPRTAVNFLRYVDDELFDGGSFFRSVRLDNQPDADVRIEVIQGGPPRAARDRLRRPIELERTSETGLAHVDGALSMARGGPDTGRAQFFICIGDQPSLDYGGARNPDRQGFAAFGRVVEGMDVVRRIQSGATDGQRLSSPVTILSVRRVR